MTVVRPASLALFATLLLGSAFAAAESRNWRFKVLLDGEPIGHHHFDLQERASESELSTDARFNVKVFGFNAFRYSHRAQELWRGGCLATLSAQTEENGERQTVHASQANDRLAVSAQKTRESLPGCVMTFAYWNPAILREKRLLNSQTGEYEKVSIEKVGGETVTIRGRPVAATRYRIRGPKHPIDLWYSEGQEWLQLESTVTGGRRLQYQLQ